MTFARVVAAMRNIQVDIRDSVKLGRVYPNSSGLFHFCHFHCGTVWLRKSVQIVLHLVLVAVLNASTNLFCGNDISLFIPGGCIGICLREVV